MARPSWQQTYAGGESTNGRRASSRLCACFVQPLILAASRVRKASAADYHLDVLGRIGSNLPTMRAGLEEIPLEEVVAFTVLHIRSPGGEAQA